MDVLEHNRYMHSLYTQSCLGCDMVVLGYDIAGLWTVRSQLSQSRLEHIIHENRKTQGNMWWHWYMTGMWLGMLGLSHGSAGTWQVCKPGGTGIKQVCEQECLSFCIVRLGHGTCVNTPPRAWSGHSRCTNR